MIQFYSNNATNLHHVTSQRGPRRDAAQHRDHTVTTDYCDATSPYVYELIREAANMSLCRLLFHLIVSIASCTACSTHATTTRMTRKPSIEVAPTTVSQGTRRKYLPMLLLGLFYPSRLCLASQRARIAENVFFLCFWHLRPRSLTLELDRDNVKVNHSTKYLYVKGHLVRELLSGHTHTRTHTHTHTVDRFLFTAAGR